MPHFLVGGATRVLSRMGAQEALKHKAGMALSASRGQAFSGTLGPNSIYF